MNQPFMPSKTYDWALRYLQGRSDLKIVGASPSSCSWHIATTGGFCVDELPKKWSNA